MPVVRTAIALLALALGAPAHAADGDCTATCWVDAVAGSDTLNHGTSAADAFATLQKAIDTVDAGGTVRVLPGLYAPNFTVVPKSVTLLGAQAGVDPLTRDPPEAAVESIVQSNICFSITGASAQVTIDGFVFRNKTVGQGTGISAGSGLSDVGASVTVVRNIFDDAHIGIAAVLAENASTFSISENLWLGGGTGILMHGDRGAATLTVDVNHFDAIANAAVSVLVWAGVTITDNTIASNVGPSDPILVGGCDGCTIARNTITAPGGFDVISLIGSDGASTNCTIEDNTITNPTRAESYGIYIGQATGTTISGNTITGAREAGIASDPASTITNNTISSLPGGGTTGIFLRAAGNGSTVTGNHVTGAAVGIDIAPSAGSLANHINRNAIVGNTAGVSNRSATLADATCNWWGNASGPSGAGPGTGDSVSANATFSPWLVGGDLANAACTGVATTTTTTTTSTTATTSTTTTVASTTSTTSTLPATTTTATTTSTTTTVGSTTSTTTTTPATTLPPVTSTTLPLLTPCPATPLSGCRPAAPGQGSLVLKRKPRAKDTLVWRWRGSGVTKSDFGNPLGATSYAFCLYDTTPGGPVLRLAAALPAGGACRGKPCWKARGTGFRYTDKDLTPDGLSAVNLRAGRAGAILGVNGKGPGLQAPMLPLGLPMRVQLLRSDASTCWEAAFGAAKKNQSNLLKATSGPQ